jgi:RNA polymerase primary sigma factor
VLGELVAPEDDDWVDDVEREMLADQLHSALDKLDELPRRVLAMRFGLDGSTPLSLQATADRLGIGVRRVRRAEEEALEVLRDDSDVIAVHEPA